MKPFEENLTAESREFLTGRLASLQVSLDKINFSLAGDLDHNNVMKLKIVEDQIREVKEKLEALNH